MSAVYRPAQAAAREPRESIHKAWYIPEVRLPPERDTMSKRPVKRRGLEAALRAFQENVQRAGPAASASYTLIGGILLLGGIGYALDEWRQTSPWFLLTGLFLGIAAGFYAIVKSTLPPRT